MPTVQVFVVPCTGGAEKVDREILKLLNGIYKLVYMEVELMGPVFESSRGELKAKRVTQVRLSSGAVVFPVGGHVAVLSRVIARVFIVKA